eukprot:4802058-Ditylum_brightwellii.AAC.1
MAFILNPYGATLDLSDKEDRKMFEIGTKDLEESQQFNRKKETFNNFAKLICHKMKEIQVLEALDVAIEWDDPAPINATKVTNIFKTPGRRQKR